MQIKIFTPPKFSKQKLDINYLNNLTNKNWQYSANGRSSIYHILKSLNIKKILIPVYICETVLEPLKKLKIEPIFYDIDIKDLNPSLESIEFLSKKFNVKVLLVASMYGNPADLVEIEKFCKDNNIFLIDDAAQSFGAKLDGRYIGTFGDAGFFSFSPGKPTAGHLGSFFWSKEDIQIKRTNHCLIHYIRWLDFYYNRYKIYEKNFKVLKKFLNLFSKLQLKLFDITNDDICEFEKDILGGILLNNLNKKFDFRNQYQIVFSEYFNCNEYFRVLTNIRGEANNHKFVLIFKNFKLANDFINYMNKNNIYASNGYKLLTNELKYLKNAKKIDRCVVELPIENDKKKMDYLFKTIKEYYD